jgi:hypothetical protein
LLLEVGSDQSGGSSKIGPYYAVLGRRPILEVPVSPDEIRIIPTVSVKALNND